MLQRGVRWLLGEIAFRAEGDAPWRFVTRAAKEGYVLWEVHAQQEAVEAKTARAAWKRLQAVAADCGCTLHLLREKGPVHTVRFLRRRSGLAAGLLCAVLLYGQLLSRVWNVEVHGCVQLAEKEVLAAAAECGLYEGARRTFDARTVGSAMMRRLPQVSWLSVNTRDCFAEIELREAAPPPEPQNGTGLSMIYAAREGQILSCEARAGELLVSPGDVVDAGQLLVNGLHETPDGQYLFENAEAVILARTWRTFTAELPAEITEQIPTGERRVRRTLRIFSLLVPLGWQTAPDAPGRVRVCTEPLKAGGVRLPVTVLTEIWEGTAPHTHRQSREELQRAAETALREAAEAALGENGRIEEAEIRLTPENGRWLAQMHCTCTEDISSEVNISLNDKNG